MQNHKDLTLKIVSHWFSILLRLTECYDVSLRRCCKLQRTLYPLVFLVAIRARSAGKHLWLCKFSLPLYGATRWHPLRSGVSLDLFQTIPCKSYNRVSDLKEFVDQLSHQQWVVNGVHDGGQIFYRNWIWHGRFKFIGSRRRCFSDCWQLVVEHILRSTVDNL